MAIKGAAPPPPRRSLPIAPTEEGWRAMSPDERERLLVKVLDALSDPRAAMFEANAELAEAKAELAMVGLRTGILAALEARGIVVEEGIRARVLGCDEPRLLQRWLLRALSAGEAREVFEAEDAEWKAIT